MFQNMIRNYKVIRIVFYRGKLEAIIDNGNWDNVHSREFWEFLNTTFPSYTVNV